MSRFKTAEDYEVQATAATARKIKWMGVWLLTGIVAMIVSVIAFYEDSPKIGNISLVVMTFSLLIFIINQIEFKFATHGVNNRDGEV